MDNIKDDIYYVKKMLKDIRFVIENSKEVSLEELNNNEILCDCLLFRLIQISENSVKLTTNFKEAHKDIPWRAIKGMRNRIVHEYGEIDFDIVYQTITESIPEICKKLECIV